MNGTIFNIQRFCTGDGLGIRTTVFLKGCPLSCAWCHNPESKSAKPQIMFNPEKCIGCGMCISVCKNSAHILTETSHEFDRTRCSVCFDCTEICYSNALEKCGETKSSDEVIDEAIRDLPFYEQSGGGVTISGGEPLAQYDFSLEILKKLKEKNIHTAVETSGYCTRSLEEIAEYVDLWLFDIKLTDEEEHRKYTGVSNEIILKNLRYLDGRGSKIILRCPVIPDVNMNELHFTRIVRLANSLKCAEAIQLEPYHPLGISKAERIGSIQKYDKKVLQPFIEKMKEITDITVEIP